MRLFPKAVMLAILTSLAAPVSAADQPGAGLEIVTMPYRTTNKSTYYMVRYDRETGRGGVASDNQYDWGRGWTHVVPYSAGGEKILFYDRTRGRGEVRKIIQSGGPSGRIGGVTDVVHTYTGWRKNWDIVTRIGNRCILFYSRNGSANIYFADRKTGAIKKRVFSTRKWTKNWSHIVDVPGGLLFYKRSTGGARIYKMKGGCKFGKTTYKTGSWRKTWSQIFPIKGSKGFANGNDALLFYDKSRGQGVIYDYKVSRGKLGKRLKLYSTWLKSWEQVLFRAGANDRNSVMFYDKHRGGFNHYFLDSKGLLAKRIK